VVNVNKLGNVETGLLNSARHVRQGYRKHEEAGVAANTVSRFGNDFGAIVETLVRIRDALRVQRFVFIPAGQPGSQGWSSSRKMISKDQESA
jgi:hypothetical protein